MPETPDLEVYVLALRARVVGEALRDLRIAHPFLLRTAVPSPAAAVGRAVLSVDRMGKRVVLTLERGIFLAVHLMIAGRLHWAEPRASLPRGRALAAFDFDNGTLILTEAGKKRRASLHVLEGVEALQALDVGGLEVIGSGLDEFVVALSRENHTLKRALTDPAILSGIGNAYSDEILHRARLSPLAQTRSLVSWEMAQLHEATVSVLEEWIEKLRLEVGDGFPTRVTAFRAGMAVHGRYGQPCLSCGTAVQRIRYAENEADYCPRCQTGGRLLADRALSRLLKADWPRTIDELEVRQGTKPKS